ncbi:MAG: AMP-binding protein [Pseudomonadota bacterium]
MKKHFCGIRALNTQLALDMGMNQEKILTADELASWQMAQLRATLKHAMQSPYYAEQLAGTDIDSLKNIADLAQLPRTEPEILRTKPFDVLCISQDDVARAVTYDTSGSTGQPKRLFFAQEDLERTINFFEHGMSTFTPKGAVVMAILPSARPSSVGRLLHEGLTRMGATAIVGNPEDGGEALAKLAYENKVSVIVGSPWHVRSLALAWAELAYTKDCIHTVLYCWDTVGPAMDTLLADTLGCTVRHHWGMTETGLGGALSCGYEGLHIREADLLVEIVEPNTGTPVADGEWGELLVTTLGRRAMPLIRYATGDRARILAAPCPCGSPMRRLDRVLGRIDDEAMLPNGETLRMMDIDAALLPIKEIVHYEAKYLDIEPAVLQLSLYYKVYPSTNMHTLQKNIGSALNSIQCTQYDLTMHTLSIEASLSQVIPQGMTFAKRRIHIEY